MFSIGGRSFMEGGRLREVVAHGFDCLHFGKINRVNSVKATKRVALFPRTTFLL